MAAAPISGAWGWAASFGDAANRSFVSRVAEDTAGNTYAVGSYSGTVNFDPTKTAAPLTSSGNKDIFVARYSPTGELDWVRSFGSSGFDEANAVAVNRDGRIVIGGTFSQTIDFDPGPGVAKLTSAGAGDAFIVALDSDGSYAWGGRFGGASSPSAYNGQGDWVVSLATDASGNIFAGGVIHGLADFRFGGSSTTVDAGSGDQDSVVVSLTPNGALRFAKVFDGSFLNGVYSISVDRAGNAIVAGFLHSTQVDFDPGPGVQLRGYYGLADAYVAKLDTNGHFLWAYAFGSAGEEAAGATVDNAGNIYFGGRLSGTFDADPGPGVALLTHRQPNLQYNGSDAFIVSLDPDGRYRWSTKFGGPADGFDVGEQLVSIATGIDGQLIVTGVFDRDFSLALPTGPKDLAVKGKIDTFVVRLNPLDGSPLSAWSFGGPDTAGWASGDMGAVYLTPSGNTIYFGGTSGDIDVDPSDTGIAILSVGNNSTGFIWKLETGTPSFAIDAASANGVEGTGGRSKPFTFEVRRLGDRASAGSVSWAVAGSGPSAANAADFAGSILPTGSVSFAPGEWKKTITVNVAADSTIETDERFSVTLSSPVGATLSPKLSAVGVIRNDDFPPPPTIVIAAASADKPEDSKGNTTPFTFTVTRSGDRTVASSVSWAVAGVGSTPANAADFTGGVLPSGTISFAAGEATKTINVNVAADSTFEPDEGFTITLSSPVGATLGVVTSANGVIRNDDLPAISIGDARVIEGDSGTTLATLLVTLSTPMPSAITVSYATVDWIASATINDYVASRGTVRFNPGETSKSVAVAVKGDTTPEPDEAFKVQLFSTDARMSKPEGIVTIVNDDLRSRISVVATDAMKAEGSSGSKAFTFTVTRTGSLEGNVTVPWAVSGSGLRPADKDDFAGGTLPTGLLSIPAGLKTATIAVYVLGDRAVEFDEQFTIKLGSPPGGLDAVVSNASVAFGTILNDDVVASQRAASSQASARAFAGMAKKHSATSQTIDARLFPAMAGASGTGTTAVTKRIAPHGFTG